MFTICFPWSLLCCIVFIKLLALPWTALVIAMLGYMVCTFSLDFWGTLFLAPLCILGERGVKLATSLSLMNENSAPILTWDFKWWQGRSSLNFGHNLTVVHYPAALLQWYTPFLSLAKERKGVIPLQKYCCRQSLNYLPPRWVPRHERQKPLIR